MKSSLKSWHACTSLWGTELVIEFRLESHEILTNAETDWLTDWLGIGILGDVRILRWTFFPWSSCFPVIAFGFLTRRTPPPFLNGPSLSVNFHIRVFFISVKQGNCMYDRPRLNVEVELGSTIQFMCELPLHLIYLRSYILGA